MAVRQGKGKVSPMFFLTEHHAMKAHWGSGGIASRPGRPIPRERASGTHRTGGRAGPRTVLEAVVKRKIPSPLRESNPRIPIIQPVGQRYVDSINTGTTGLPQTEISIHFLISKANQSFAASFAAELKLFLILLALAKLYATWRNSTGVRPKKTNS
jgi:hypothetical protein